MKGSFRRVEGEQAGPDALGILVPPGRRTFVILRPRSLPWDLVVCRGPHDLTFADFPHDEASACAQNLFRALRAWGTDSSASIDFVPTSAGSFLRVLLGAYALLVCPRQPGRPYVPLVCSEVPADPGIGLLRDILCPPMGREQEVYFNVRFFER